MQELAKRDRPNKILIEDKASGTQLIQDLKADGIYAITAYQPPSGTDKIMRLHAQTAAFENGRVMLPLRAPWLSEYINELTRAKPHWLESLKGDSGTIESVIRCPDRKMLGDGDGLAAGTELFGGSAGAGAGGG